MDPLLPTNSLGKSVNTVSKLCFCMIAGMEMCRPPREAGPVTKAFIRRFNIVDPLLPANNLGKSINIASKLRIREALSRGSHTLASIFAKVMVAAYMYTQPIPWSQLADNYPSLGYMSRELGHIHMNTSRSRDHSLCASLWCPSIKPLKTSPVLGSLEARRLMKRCV